MNQSFAFTDASSAPASSTAAEPPRPACAVPVTAVPQAPVGSAAPLLQALSRDELSPRARRLLTGGVVAAHVLGAWGLLQIEAVQKAVVEAAPLMVRMIAPEAPPKPTPPPPPPPPPPPRIPKPQRVAPAPAQVIAVAPTPTPEPPSFVVPVPVPAPEPPPVVVAAPPAPAPPAPVAPPAPPAPPPVAPSVPKQIAPGAVRYLVEPRMSVPLLSRRLKESGTVVLRITVDVRGLLKGAVVTKSSGFPRLDEQALQDIRSARFAPQTENGQPIEWQTLAPLAYEVN
ncbi:MAG: energy transducer TonB [Ideonella sp.]